MTDSERKKLRDLQNRWLALPYVQRQISLFGWDEPIAMAYGLRFETYREIRDALHPDLEWWFEEFLGEHPRIN